MQRKKQVCVVQLGLLIFLLVVFARYPAKLCESESADFDF